MLIITYKTVFGAAIVLCDACVMLCDVRQDVTLDGGRYVPLLIRTSRCGAAGSYHPSHLSASRRTVHFHWHGAPPRRAVVQLCTVLMARRVGLSRAVREARR